MLAREVKTWGQCLIALLLVKRLWLRSSKSDSNDSNKPKRKKETCRLGAEFSHDLTRRPPSICFSVTSAPPPSLAPLLAPFIMGRSAGVPDFTYHGHNVEKNWKHLHHSPSESGGVHPRISLPIDLSGAGGKGRSQVLSETDHCKKARAQPVGNEGSSLGPSVKPAPPTPPSIIIKDFKIPQRNTYMLVG